MEHSNNCLVWFRKDLRLTGNKALIEASKQGHVIGLYLIDPQMGEAQKWWLHHSLTSLHQDLKKHQVDLIVRASDLLSIVQELNIKKVFWNRCYDPLSIERDTALKKNLKERQITVQSFNSSLLIEPEHFKNKQGGIYKVFTPFWKQIRQTTIPKEEFSPVFHFQKPSSFTFNIDAFNLLPKHPNWAKDFMFKPGEHEAKQRLKNFLEDNVLSYSHNRDYPSLEGTSGLSSSLHLGELGPEQVYAQAYKSKSEQFLAELGWREFAHYLLYHFPTLINEPLNEKFKFFETRKSHEDFKAWKQGLTGYPLVDAGMRQLWRTGWMHNRVRMVVASFLTKHLLLPWQWGASWFLDTLLDADVASNTINWQWVAGCGPDAAPFYRIFNPVMQSEKFDQNADYIKTYIPELSHVPLKYIHKPWIYPYKTSYPSPIIEHHFARQRALEAYNKIRTFPSS